MNTKQLKIGTMLSYVQIIINIVINLIYTPFMVNALGQSEYGLYQTITSTISMLSILSLGFNASYIRYYTKYKKENDYDSISKLNGLFVIVFSVIGLIALICGVYLSIHLNVVFSSGLTKNEYQIARILMLILTINLSISFPMSVFSNIITAHERFIFLKLLGIVKNLAGPLVSLPLLLLGFRSIALVSITVTISITVDLIYFHYVKKKLHQKFIFYNFEKGLLKSMFIYTSFIAINMLVDQININIDKVLLSRYKGTTATAIYAIGFNLYVMYQSVSGAVSTVFTPRIHRIINETKNSMCQQRKLLTNIFIKVGRIQYMILMLVLTGVLFFGHPFITRFWVGINYNDSYYVAMLLIISSSIALIQNIGIEIQRAQNNHQFRSISYLIMAIMNLLLSIYLCQLYGAIGSAIGTAISLIVANGLVMNIYYHYKCNINILEFWKNILNLSKGLIIPILLGIYINLEFSLNSILEFCALVLIYTVVYIISVSALGMNTYEKSQIKALIKKFRRSNTKYD